MNVAIPSCIDWYSIKSTAYHLQIPIFTRGCREAMWQCESKVSHPRTQHNGSGKGFEPELLILESVNCLDL